MPRLNEYLADNPSRIAALARYCDVDPDAPRRWITAPTNARHRLPSPRMAVLIWKFSKGKVSPNDLYLPACSARRRARRSNGG